MKKILFSTSPTGRGDAALRAAAALATSEGAELVILELEAAIDARRVFDPDGVPETGNRLSPLRRDFPDVVVRSQQARGNPVRVVCEVAAVEHPDIIVVPNWRPFTRQPLLSRGASRSLVARAPCPVLLVTP